MSQIAAHDFTGIVFYAGYHPFEYFLDYKEMPDVADQPADHRDAVRQRLSRGLEIAHKHGLTTFIQHYVGHFTEALMHKYSIKHLGRLSDIVHPEVERYTRYSAIAPRSSSCRISTACISTMRALPAAGVT